MVELLLAVVYSGSLLDQPNEFIESRKVAEVIFDESTPGLMISSRSSSQNLRRKAWFVMALVSTSALSFRHSVGLMISPPFHTSLDL